ncbi:MAG: hypothetical protein AAGG08_03360 [Actinomycetota bacterium]
MIARSTESARSSDTGQALESIGALGLERVATLREGRRLIFNDGVRERTKGAWLVYAIVNPDGSCWKVGQTGLRGPGKPAMNPGWSRLSSYRRVLAGRCGDRPGEVVKGQQILAEVQEGAQMFIMFSANPLADEHRLSQLLQPTESGRKATGPS